jgi:predicted nucleic acid-binding protein
MDAAQLSYWDALIVAAAERGGCDRLLTEDLQHGQRLGALTVVNPFLVQPAALGFPSKLTR